MASSTKSTWSKRDYKAAKVRLKRTRKTRLRLNKLKSQGLMVP